MSGEEDELISTAMSSPNPILHSDPSDPMDDSTSFTTADIIPENSTASTPTMANDRKKLFLKNPWGNASYAELIAKAIRTSSRGSLTLSEIYDW